tara:strand:- start:59 stop:460 length:402 start_codon:yes stop_codon:yes gene_type:complete
MKKILLVVSDYYEDISSNLIIGAKEKLLENKESISFEIIKAPGSFEIPFIINQNIDNYDGFIALGCVIRGETYHFELIANECAKKIMDLSISSNKPIGFGILTCENLEQAITRSDPKKSNKGYEAANACVSLL